MATKYEVTVDGTVVQSTDDRNFALEAYANARDASQFSTEVTLSKVQVLARTARNAVVETQSFKPRAARAKGEGKAKGKGATKLKGVSA